MCFSSSFPWTIFLLIFAIFSRGLTVNGFSVAIRPLDPQARYFRCGGVVPASFSNQRRMSLATFCQQEGGVTCDTTSYPNVHHDRLAASEWVRRNGLSFLASGDNLRHRFAQRIAELCYIKCTCEPDAALDANTPPGPPPVIETGRVASDSMLSEWNFDSQTGLIRQQLPEEKFWTKTGYMGKEMVYLNHYSRGSEANRPTCYANDLDHGLVLYLHARTGIYYSSPASLCLHRYYEGHENASLGGVCLLNENGKRFLAFDHVNRAPIYSIDNFDPQSTLADRTIPQAVSVYCKNYCWCDSDKETEAAAKKEVATGQLSFVDIFEPHPDPTTQAYDETLAELAREVDMKASEQPSGSSSQQCGNTCGRDYECGSASCKCAAYEKTLSTDRSAKFFATCVSAALISAANSHGSRQRVRYRGLELRGRSLDAEISPSCPCNLTYVSYGCCHVDNGIIFEDVSLKLGELL